MSIDYAKPPLLPGEATFSVIFSDWDPDAPAGEDSQPFCLACFIEDADEQVARGMDLAKVHGRVDWDVDEGEWFLVPEDERL